MATETNGIWSYHRYLAISLEINRLARERERAEIGVHIVKLLAHRAGLLGNEFLSAPLDPAYKGDLRGTCRSRVRLNVRNQIRLPHPSNNIEN